MEGIRVVLEHDSTTSSLFDDTSKAIASQNIQGRYHHFLAAEIQNLYEGEVGNKKSEILTLIPYKAELEQKKERVYAGI